MFNHFAPRDEKGRFATYKRPHGHAACGKGQYKSRECKARAIRKHAMQTGEASERQMAHINWINTEGRLGI